MKAIHRILSFTLTTLIIFLMACQENEIPTPQSAVPEIQIISPTANDSTYKSGNPILLQVQFDDDEELHEIAIQIIRIHDGAMVYQRNLHQHGNSYRWIDSLILTTEVASDFEIRAIATDHELQRTDTSETFRMMPQ